MGVPPALPGRQQKFNMSGGRCPRSIAATRMASRQAHEGESHRLQFGCPPPLRNASTCVETIHPECQCAVRAAQPIRGIEVQQMDWSYKSRWDLRGYFSPHPTLGKLKPLRFAVVGNDAADVNTDQTMPGI